MALCVFDFSQIFYATPPLLPAAFCADQIVESKERGRDAYELEAVGLFHILRTALWRETETTPVSARGLRDPDVEIQKQMVAYISQHYGEKLRLEDIAAAGHVSRSKCCQIFRRFMGSTPVDFLNLYRLKVSREMLSATQRSVTEIALSCGFHHLSYFSSLFARTYGRAPTEYRRIRDDLEQA